MKGLRRYRVQGVQRNLTRGRGRADTDAERVTTWVEEWSKNKVGDPLGAHRGRPKLQVLRLSQVSKLNQASESRCRIWRL